MFNYTNRSIRNQTFYYNYSSNTRIFNNITMRIDVEIKFLDKRQAYAIFGLSDHNVFIGLQ